MNKKITNSVSSANHVAKAYKLRNWITLKLFTLFALIFLLGFSAMAQNNSVFSNSNVLRINDNFDSFLKASLEVSAADRSHTEWINITPNFIEDGVEYISVAQLKEIADAEIAYDKGNVILSNKYNSVTINEEGKTSNRNIIVNKKMVLMNRRDALYVPVRVAHDLGLGILTDSETNTIRISKPYIAHTLIVLTDNINIDTYGATKAVISTKYTCYLYYETVEQAEYAYQQFSKHKDVKVVEFNEIIATVGDLEEDVVCDETNTTRMLINGVYAENQAAMNAIDFATGSANLDQIASIYGYKDDDVVGVFDTGFWVEAEYANMPLTEIVNPYDVTDGDTNVWSPANSHHGTHVLGIVAQFSKGCKIMPVKVFNDAGVCTIANSLDAFNFILPYNQELNSQGKKLVAISMSYGGVGYSETVQQKIDELYNAGIISVAGAGNDNHNARIFRFANLSHVVAVGSINQFSSGFYGYDISGFSNFGECVDVYAPGEQIYSEIGVEDGVTIRGNKWGTSMATPVVTGNIMLMYRSLYYASQALPQIFEVSPKSIIAYLKAGNNYAIKLVGLDSEYSQPYNSLVYYLNLNVLAKTSKIQSGPIGSYAFSNYLIPNLNSTSAPSPTLGTQNNPFLISSASDLSRLSTLINREMDVTNLYFKQVADISVAGDFMPIGFISSGITPYTVAYPIRDIKNPFSGHYDGDNNAINFTNSNMNFKKSYSGNSGEDIGSIIEYGGVFGWIKNGSVKNLFVKYNGNAQHVANYGGGFVGYLESGTIDKCAVIENSASQISATNLYTNVSGFSCLVGTDATISNSYTNVGVRGYTNIAVAPNNYNTSYIAGYQHPKQIKVAGYSIRNQGSIVNCYSTGNVYDIPTYPEIPVDHAATFITECTAGSTTQNSYWLDRSPQSGILTGSNYSTGCGGRTSEQLQTQSNFIDWDFYNIWKMDANMNNGYPIHLTSDEIIFVPVSNIVDVPTEARPGILLVLSGSVVPSYATNKTIVWSIENAGTTGASIAGNIFTVTTIGTAIIRATIVDGLAIGTDYIQDFTITVKFDCINAIIGNGTITNSLIPISNYNSYSQQIFDASEVGVFDNDVMINSISFQYINNIDLIKGNQTIYLGHTNKTTFSNISDYVPLSQLTPVFSGNVKYSNAQQWCSIDFDNPFPYTGGNIVVAVLNNDPFSSGVTGSFRCHSANGNKTVRFSNTSYTINPNSPISSGYVASLATDRNNIQFNICWLPYTVTLPTITGATIAPSGGSSSPVNYGGNYSFTVTLGACYSNSTITVKANGTVLTPVSGVYTISNITANQTVTVEGVQINTYTVTLPTVTGATITPTGGSNSPVNCSSNYSFTVTLGACYSNSTITVKANGTVLTPTAGVFTISNITANQTVTIEGVQINTYTVTLPTVTGATITPMGGSSSPVNCGSNYSFTVTLGACYTNSSITVKANGTVLTPTAGVYTISNISANQTVIIEGVQINTYTVTLPTVTGITITPAGGSSSPVNCGGNYSFTVALGACYTNSTITVKANGTILTPTAGVYTISNITANQNVTVEGVQINTYTVTFMSNGGEGTMPPQEFTCSDPQNLTANSFTKPQYVFTGWNIQANGNGESYENQQSITVEDDMTLFAQWQFIQPNEFVITATATIGGTITPNGEIIVKEGASQSFTIIPEENYTILDVLVDNVSKGAIVEYLFENVQSNHTIHAVFEDVSVGENITPQMQIYPNPTKDEIFIKSELQIKKVEVYSIIGALLLTENNFNEKISISTLAKGVYLLKIFTDHDIVIEKVVKE